MYLSPTRAARGGSLNKDYLIMVRKLFSSITALGLLLAACGDDGNGSTTDNTNGTGSAGTTGNPTGNESTGAETPTTTNGGTATEVNETGVVDPSTTTSVDPSTTSGNPETTAPETTAPETTAPVDTGETTDPSGGDPVEQCKMMADPQTECSDCVCENCLEELQACQADEGCVAIRMCAEETGCTGFDCLQACGDVIDMYGGIAGESAMIGLQISMCLDQNCSDQCG